MPPPAPPDGARAGLLALALLLISIVGLAARAHAQAAAAYPDTSARAGAASDTLARASASPSDSVARTSASPSDSLARRAAAPAESLAAHPAPSGVTTPLASPFPRVALASEPAGRYTWSYAALGTGVVLVGASFLLAHRANDTYDAYLRETDPARIERLFDRSVWLDRGSSGSLLVGEALLCLGIYSRFLRRPSRPLAWSLEPGRCAVSYRF